MKNFKYILLLLISFFTFELYSQNIKTVTNVKGVGLNREQAIQSALRACVEQGFGAVVSSSTQVENFVTVKDAVVTRTEGVVKTYKIIKETPLKDTYEVIVDAEVSLDPIKQNFDILSQMTGGIRFLVMFDSRKFDEDQVKDLNFICDRLNEKFKSNNIRYVQRDAFERLKNESYGILGADTTNVSFVQKIGMFADAPFIALIKDIEVETQEKAAGISSTKVKIHIETYDNCIAEGLGPVVMDGSWKNLPNKSDAKQQSIIDAINMNYDRMMLLFNSSVSSWINNGAPYELRFYGLGGPRNLRGLFSKLQADPDFGGTFEPYQTENFVKLNVTFKKKPYEMYNKVLDYADEIPELKAKVLDAKLQYVRQISFAPTDVTIPEAVQKQQVVNAAGVGKGENK